MYSYDQNPHNSSTNTYNVSTYRTTTPTQYEYTSSEPISYRTEYVKKAGVSIKFDETIKMITKEEWLARHPEWVNRHIEQITYDEWINRQNMRPVISSSYTNIETVNKEPRDIIVGGSQYQDETVKRGGLTLSYSSNSPSRYTEYETIRKY